MYPEAAEIAGNAIDENCDGVAAPLPDVAPSAIAPQMPAAPLPDVVPSAIASRMPDRVTFANSPRQVRVHSAGRFIYSFVATAGHRGSVRLTSTKGVRIGSTTRKLRIADTRSIHRQCKTEIEAFSRQHTGAQARQEVGLRGRRHHWRGSVLVEADAQGTDERLSRACPGVAAAQGRRPSCPAPRIHRPVGPYAQPARALPRESLLRLPALPA